MNKTLLDFIKKSPTAFHAVKNTAEVLSALGYTELSESENWELEYGKGYYVTRNSSSIIAFRTVPDFSGFIMSAAHSDSPSFKIKENSEMSDGNYKRLSIEKYGGMLMAPWFDRPLSIAGRVVVKNGEKIESRLIDTEKNVAIIPSVAIHMNRNANENAKYDPATDMVPLYSDIDGRSLKALAASLARCPEDDLISTDLFLCIPDAGTEWGDYISAPRLDDLQCAFASLIAFTNAKEKNSIPVFCLFDNEEVGSLTKQGASSTFLTDTLSRICSSLGYNSDDYRRKVANSFLVSCDNAHAIHPNHPELSDKNHAPKMNGGVVIKYNASQKYTTDAMSSAVFRTICERACVPFQLFANRADIPGGSTLGNLINSNVSLNTVDVGLAQLAMHSCFETAGKNDTDYLVKALEEFFKSSIYCEKDGVLEVK